MSNALLVILLLVADAPTQTHRDVPFWQESIQRMKVEVDLTGLELRSIRADRDGRVLINTNRGLLKATDGRLVAYAEMAGLVGLDHRDLETLEGKFVFLTDKFLLPIHGAGRDYVGNAEFAARRVAALGPGHNVLLSAKELIEVRDGKIVRYPVQGYTDLVTSPQGSLYLYGQQLIARYEGDGRWTPLPVPTKRITAVSARANGAVAVGTEDGLFVIEGDKIAPWPHKIPTTSITALVDDAARGWLWVGTTVGAFRQDADGANSYYAENRCLDDNHVLDLTLDAGGDVWILTKKGVTLLDFREMTLEEKADRYLAHLRKHHIRFGLVADVHTPAGDYAQVRMHDSDNDGLWSSMYLASEAYRYAVTGQVDARENLMDGLDAIERLVTITGIPGFQARSFELEGFRVSDPHAWRKRPQRDFEWKGTTSSDELCGTMFFYQVLLDTLGEKEPDVRRRIGTLVGSIVGHLLDHDLYYVDADGKPTRWGYWNPKNINTPAALHDRRLNSIEILAFLQLAYKLTGEERFKSAFDDLVDTHGYAKNSVRYLPDPLGPWNHSDDELYWLSYHVLLADPLREELRSTYLQSAEEQFAANRRKRNPLWNTIYGLRTHREIDLAGVVFWLQEFPLDMRRWGSKNSHRKDITLERRPFVPPETVPVLPQDERTVHKWNTNEMTPDGGGDGTAAESGAEYLLPYWMARHAGYISEPSRR